MRASTLPSVGLMSLKRKSARNSARRIRRFGICHRSCPRRFRYMNEEQFRKAVGQHLLKDVYEQVRREQAHPPTPAQEPFRRIESREEDKHRTCVPLYTLKAAAGEFGDGQQVEPDGWVVPK